MVVKVPGGGAMWWLTKLQVQSLHEYGQINTQLRSASALESRGGGAIESRFTATNRHPTSVWHAGDK